MPYWENVAQEYFVSKGDDEGHKLLDVYLLKLNVDKLNEDIKKCRAKQDNESGEESPAEKAKSGLLRIMPKV